MSHKAKFPSSLTLEDLGIEDTHLFVVQRDGEDLVRRATGLSIKEWLSSTAAGESNDGENVNGGTFEGP